MVVAVSRLQWQPSPRKHQRPAAILAGSRAGLLGADVLEEQHSAAWAQHRGGLEERRGGIWNRGQRQVKTTVSKLEPSKGRASADALTSSAPSASSSSFNLELSLRTICGSGSTRTNSLTTAGRDLGLRRYPHQHKAFGPPPRSDADAASGTGRHLRSSSGHGHRSP